MAAVALQEHGASRNTSLSSPLVPEVESGAKSSAATTCAPGGPPTPVSDSSYPSEGGINGEPEARRSIVERSIGALTVNGIRHSTLTLTSTALGGGVLSVSYVMQLCGVGLGTAMLLTGGTLSYLSIAMLMRMSVQTGCDTYAALFSHCAGPRAGPILDAMLFFYGVGACVGYMVFLGDFLPALVTFVAPHAAPWLSSRWLAITFAAVAVLPLALQKSVSALRFVSPVSICALLYMAAVVAVKAGPLYHQNHGQPEYGELVVARLDPHFCEAFALCVFAFNCHLNVVPVAGVLVRPSKERIQKISARVNALQLCFYCLIGITGYLSFLAKTPQDILVNYDANDIAVAGGRLMLTGTMLVAIPMNLHPTIRSGLQIGDYLRSGRLPPEKEEAVRLVLTTVCVAIQALLAINVPGVADVLSILGATVATAMMLAIPAYAMGVIMPRTPGRRAQQAILALFACISVLSVPIKVLRWTKVLQD